MPVAASQREERVRRLVSESTAVAITICGDSGAKRYIARARPVRVSYHQHTIYETPVYAWRDKGHKALMPFVSGVCTSLSLLYDIQRLFTGYETLPLL